MGLYTKWTNEDMKETSLSFSQSFSPYENYSYLDLKVQYVIVTKQNLF